MKSLSCNMKNHSRCKGEYFIHLSGPKKKPHPCACECHARHIAPMLEEMDGRPL